MVIQEQEKSLKRPPGSFLKESLGIDTINWEIVADLIVLKGVYDWNEISEIFPSAAYAKDKKSIRDTFNALKRSGIIFWENNRFLFSRDQLYPGAASNINIQLNYPQHYCQRNLEAASYFLNIAQVCAAKGNCSFANGWAVEAICHTLRAIGLDQVQSQGTNASPKVSPDLLRQHLQTLSAAGLDQSLGGQILFDFEFSRSHIHSGLCPSDTMKLLFENGLATQNDLSQSLSSNRAGF